MVLVKVVCNGEDLTEGKGTLISLDDVRELENGGFTVIIL